jgi:hypothetical protein
MTDDQTYLRLKPIVGNPAWDVYEKLLRDRLQDVREDMDECTPDKVKEFQGMIRIYKDLLTLRETVIRIDNHREA